MYNSLMFSYTSPHEYAHCCFFFEELHFKTHFRTLWSHVRIEWYGKSRAAVCFLESPGDIHLLIWLMFVATKGLFGHKGLISCTWFGCGGKKLIMYYICFSLAESFGREDCLDRQTASFAELISQRVSIWHLFSMLRRIQGEKPRARLPVTRQRMLAYTWRFKLLFQLKWNCAHTNWHQKGPFHNYIN